MAREALESLDKSTGQGMLHCAESMHSQREMTWSTVLLKARLFQDPSVGQLWCNNSSALPEKKRVGRSVRDIRASDMTDLLSGRPKSSVLDSQRGNTQHLVCQAH